jgi:hypothetical protein
MERRVNTVELRPISLLTKGQVAAIVAGGESLDTGPDTIVSLNAPNQYKRIIEGYYYSNLVTGTEPRVELYFSADTGLDADKTIRVEGVHQLDDNGTAVEFRLSGDYKTLEVDTPPWEERDSFNGNRHTPGGDVTNTALFKVDSGNEYSSRKSLIVSRQIAFSEATTTTAKLTFTGTNYFKEGDVVFVDMPSTSLYYEIDGLFTVKEAGSNFITYDFTTPLAEPINYAGVAGNRSVYAVARSATRDGATWINTGTDPDTIFAWKGIRWITYSTGDVTKDEIAPGPVTNLEATSTNDTPDGNAIGLSRVTLTWTAPTNSADETPIDDLVGYTIWWRQFATQEWQKADITGADTTFSMNGFQQGSAAYFRVFARDASGNRSIGTDITHTTGRSNPVIARPGPPVVESYLGTIKISYNDLTALGNVQSGTAKEVQVYWSTVNDFDITSPGAYYGKFAAGNRSFIIIPGTELVHDTDYYFKINIRDIYGNVTEPSAQVSVRAQLEDIVTYNMLEVGSLDGQTITGLQIQTNDNPGVNGGIILTKQQLVAYAPPGEVGGSASQTFRIDSATGAVFIGDYLGKEEAAGFYLGKDDAKTEYSTNVRADGIELKATNAGTSAAGAQNTANTAITRINAGEISVTSEFRNRAIEALNRGVDPGNTTTINGGSIKTGTVEAAAIKAGTLDVGVVYAGEISASKIKGGSITADLISTTSLNAANLKSGTIDADRITTASISAAKINADNINTGSLNGDRITGGTITGSTVQTTASGKRVRLSSTTDALEILNTNGVVSGRVEAIGSNAQQIIVQTADTTGSFSCGTNSVSLGAGNNSINLTTSSMGMIVSADNVHLRAVATPLNTNFNIVHSQNGGPSVQGRLSRVQLSGTGNRNVYVSPSGLLTLVPSDERLKQNIEPLTLGLNIIEKLEPKKFEFKDEPGIIEYGLIAQEVRDVLNTLGITDNTNLVFEDESEGNISRLPEGEAGPVLGVEYTKLIPILLNSVKELQSRVEFLEKERETK